ncbi:hypothetical protein QUF80_16175 [Desulfococcaceae bacterium HSG8]|nr:hypothetical protein [Desulfococcaceae bacterium HSG8]
MNSGYEIEDHFLDVPDDHDNGQYKAKICCISSCQMIMQGYQDGKYEDDCFCCLIWQYVENLLSYKGYM